MFYGLDGGGVFSMDPSAEEREPGILLENSEEESSDTICTGENSKYVSNRVSIVEWLIILRCENRKREISVLQMRWLQIHLQLQQDTITCFQ